MGSWGQTLAGVQHIEETTESIEIIIPTSGTGRTKWLAVGGNQTFGGAWLWLWLSNRTGGLEGPRSPRLRYTLRLA